MQHWGTKWRSHALGVTLIELLMTITIAVIAMSIAMPAMGKLLAQWHKYRATRAIIDHFQLARSTAIKTNQRVIVCNSVDGAGCAALAQTDWAGGWIVFQDGNADNIFGTDDTLVAVAGPQQGISSMASSNSVRRYVFLPNGLMSSGMSSLVITPSLGDDVKVVVSRVGRIRLSNAQN